MTTGPSGQRGSAGSIHSFGSGGGAPSAAQAQAQAQMRHAQSEIYKTASEVEPQNSLAAIASEVDDAASALRAGDVPTGELGLKQVQGDADVANTPAAVVQAAQQQQQQQGGYWGGDAYGYDYAAQAGAGYAPNGQAYYAAPPAAGYAGGYDGAAYAQQQHAAALAAQQAAAAAGMAGNPYFAAAQGYLGYPGADGAGGSSASAGSHVYPHGGLVRQSTSLSMASSNSAAAQRKKRQNSANAQQQTLPFNKPFVDEYRHRMKADPDPEAQFAFAKYLIEAAKKVNDPKDGPKQARKYRDNLLSESLKLIKRLATTGMDLGKPPYAEAQFFLANCFGNGSLGLQVDHEKAYNLYVQASKQNHPAATYRTAVCNEVGAGTKRDHHRAVLFYRKASALGDTAGMYKLGMIMLNGLLGQPRNPREAVVWLKRAAGQADEENPHALHELGLLHEKPNNGVVMHDEAYARELFTQAAQLGYAPSQFKLGSAYEYGALTCPVDPRRSIAWYTKAAGKNDGESELALSGWYLTGSEGVLKQSDSEAYLWARRAASKGIPKAEYAVGYYSEVGIGVEANVEEAKRWYMRAAAQGNKRAMQRLTELKKLGARGGKRGARPTRKDAESECTVM